MLEQEDQDVLPLALRRPRRSGVSRAHRVDRPTETQTHHHPPQTPSRENNKKRVRFSDPGRPAGVAAPERDSITFSLPSPSPSNASSSTGLTPFLRRAKLSGSSSSPGNGRTKRRRPSAGPATTLVSRCRDADHDIFTPDRDTGYGGQVTFLPMRQVLDGRVKRRIRRNGLSEEMNVISAEKRRKALQDKAEMDSLRAALAARDIEIRRLSGATVVATPPPTAPAAAAAAATDGEGGGEESIIDLKKQVEQLRRALKSPAPSSSGLSDSTQVDWTATAGDDGHSSGGGGHSDSDNCLEMNIDFEDDGDHFFDESTIAELACSTPTRRRADPRNSFPTPPSTSPIMRLVTPPMRKLFAPTSHAAVQAQAPDERRREAAAEELASLQLEVGRLTSALEAYEAMTRRLSDKLAPFAPEGGSAAGAILGSRSPTVKVEAQLNQLLRAFRDRTAALARVGTSLDSLGIRASDAPEAIASLAAAFRSARLELEYLEPGESALPLSASGAAVLDLLLARLRELARERLEHADTIDEYQAVEVSLRRQLSARVGAMDDMRHEISTLKGKVKLRNVRIQELEAGMDRLRKSVQSYTRDIAELETLAQRLEGDLDAANKGLREAEDLREAREEELGEALASRDSTVSLLETKLGLALEQTAALRAQLTSLERQHGELQARHKEELATVDQQHGSALERMDTKISTMRAEVDKANKALQEAQETVCQLQIEKGSLDSQLDAEKVKTRAGFETMRSEFEKVVRMGEDLMVTSPRTLAEK